MQAILVLLLLQFLWLDTLPDLSNDQADIFIICLTPVGSTQICLLTIGRYS